MQNTYKEKENKNHETEEKLEEDSNVEGEMRGRYEESEESNNTKSN